VAVSLPLLLIIIGIVLALLVSWILGVIVIVIGLVLLIAPRLRATGTRARPSSLVPEHRQRRDLFGRSLVPAILTASPGSSPPSSRPPNGSVDFP
jgi:hypothetical protein